VSGWLEYVPAALFQIHNTKVDYISALGNNWKEVFGECTKETAFELLDTFFDLGGNFIDSSNSYQSGQSEEWIGEWLQKTRHREEMVISTKYTQPYMLQQPVQQSNFGGTGTKSMHLAIEASLKKLQTDYIDLVSKFLFHHSFLED
jgi:aryl-alcohol dehydrogenase-like predicted oxidoreductase